MQAGFRSLKVGKLYWYDFYLRQRFLKLYYCLGIGAETLTDRKCVVINPEKITAFCLGLTMQPIVDRDAHARKLLGDGLFLSTPEGFAHTQDDRALVTEDDWIVDKDGVGVVGQGNSMVDNLSAKLSETVDEVIMFLLCGKENGLRSIMPF